MMFSKKSASALAALVISAVIFTSSCKKNDDVSMSTPGDQTSQPSQMVTNSNTNGFTVTASDGHLIGVNGVKPVVNPKTGVAQTMGCGSACCVSMSAVSVTGGCLLYTGWSSNGGYWVALYINGVQYKDSGTGYGLWLSSVNGISASVGGLSAGQVYHAFVRTYCNADTTGSPYYDSPVASYTVPATFVCGSGGTTGGGTTGGTTGGHGGHKH